MDYQLTDDVINQMLNAAKVASEHGEKTPEYALAKSVESLYSMMLQCDAIGKFHSDEPKRVLRVIKCKRMVPKGILKILDSMHDDTGIYSRVYCSGLYIVVPCVVIPRNFLENDCVASIYKNMKVYTVKGIPELDKLGVGLVETSLSVNSDGDGIVLERSPLTDILYYANHYQVLEIR